MKNIVEDLWPDQLINNSIHTPFTILQAQASLLGAKLGNLIQAQVQSSQDVEGDFFYHFYLIAPQLGNYHYRLFSIRHSIPIYPVTIFVDEEMFGELHIETKINASFGERLAYKSNLSLKGFLGTNTPSSSKKYTLQADSETKYKNILKKIFRSKKMNSAISVLYAQITSIQDSLIEQELDENVGELEE